MSILSVRGLQKSFREGVFLKSRLVLKDISFELQEGSATGLLGNNGSGKTTTFKCLLRISLPDRGEVTYFGKHPFSVKIKEKIGFLPEQPYFYSFLTGFELLKFYGSFHTNYKRNVLRDRIHDLLKKVHLFKDKDHLLKTYSRGMLQRIGIAQTLIHEPRLLILDEPLGGLDPAGRIEIIDVIKGILKNEGASLFLSSHLLSEAESYCDRLVILKSGKVAFSGKTKDFLSEVEETLQITFEKESKIKSEEVVGIENLQKKIDRLRKEKASIVEIKKVNTLERAFVKLSSDKKN